MEQINFKQAIENLADTGFSPMPNTIQISIPDAKDVLWRGIKYFTGDAAKWRPEYEEIAQWLANNKGRGLLCTGNCGLGKTLICCKIIPLLLHHYHRKIVYCYGAQQLNVSADAIISKHILCIDDVGTECESVKYGERRRVFAELVDEAEKKGKLLIITSNLPLEELKKKYGERTIDRLKAITTKVLFMGESLRK
ncbi:P-loop NTPase family protein [Bacteroides eggerthii]|uniref:hypothetical protein n=1 Tax=Bacteroides eggerthii TaxID=28111 RepID=UPI00189D795C|nr:hypothetical protein [Bacteroides eggerthii]